MKEGFSGKRRLHGPRAGSLPLGRHAGIRVIRFHHPDLPGPGRSAGGESGRPAHRAPRTNLPAMNAAGEADTAISPLSGMPGQNRSIDGSMPSAREKFIL